MDIRTKIHFANKSTVWVYNLKDFVVRDAQFPTQ